MSFPIETYSIAMRLADLLQLKQFRVTSDGKWRKGGGTPESKLLALLIIACKLGYELEQTEEWKEWAMPTEEELRVEKGTANADVTENNVLTMSDLQLDEYMDWIQLNWIDHDAEITGANLNWESNEIGKRRIPESILAMFPLSQPDSLDKAHSPALPTQATVNLFLPLQPTDGRHNRNYTIYRTSATTRPVLNRMIQRGAAMVGVDDASLRYTIRWLESKLNKWRIEQNGSKINVVQSVV
jgi:hypothetical protein